MKIAAAVMASLLLSACTLRGPSVEVRPPDVAIDGIHGHGDGHRGGRHCPPGQAKKGRC